jgi:SAM-dependent methyltransferase
MELDELRRHWNGLGQEDPLFSILTVPGKDGGRWNAEEFFGTGRQQVDHVFQQLETLGVKVQHGSALDFGCGVGRLAQALVDRFDVVHGVDIAPSMISLAERYNRFGSRPTRSSRCWRVTA